MKTHKTKREASVEPYDLAIKLYESKRYSEAFQIAHQASLRGEITCYNLAGIMYGDGKGVRKSHRTALYWLKKLYLAKQTDSVMKGIAANNIGCTYRDMGCFKEAEFWFKCATQNLDGDAWLELAKLYCRPLDNKVLARKALKKVIAAAEEHMATEASSEEAIRLIELHRLRM